tara:strand:- start:1847 stop:2242 length:396 start_codon:yes stop_codon:yes gene_type:complete
MLYFIIHLFLLLIPTLYADIYSNKIFADINKFENSIILTFEPDPLCNYDIKFSFWPPRINVTKEGEGSVLYYDAPSYIDMERISVVKRDQLVHIILPIRRLKLDRIPEDNFKHIKVYYEEIDIETELSMLM